MNITRAAILEYAENRNYFRFDELLSYLKETITISKVALSWHLREMVKNNTIYKLGRGLYTHISQRSTPYTPFLRKKAVKLAKNISKEFPFISVSVFDGNTLSFFQQHLSANNAIYIEVDRDAMESVFHYLKREGYTAFLKPGKNFVYDNIDLSRNVVIVKPLISESPLMEYDGIKTPTLEKILVDIKCDDDLDYLNGAEWSYIVENVKNSYSISVTTILRYASRRNATNSINNFFTINPS